MRDIFILFGLLGLAGATTTCDTVRDVYHSAGCCPDTAATGADCGLLSMADMGPMMANVTMNAGDNKQAQFIFGCTDDHTGTPYDTPFCDRNFTTPLMVEYINVNAMNQTLNGNTFNMNHTVNELSRAITVAHKHTESVDCNDMYCDHRVRGVCSHQLVVDGNHSDSKTIGANCAMSFAVVGEHRDIKSCGSMHCECDITGDCVNIAHTHGTHSDTKTIDANCNTALTVGGHHHDVKSCGSMYCACDVTGDCVNIVQTHGTHNDSKTIGEDCNTALTVAGHHHDIKSCGSMYCECDVTGDCVNVAHTHGSHTDTKTIDTNCNTALTVGGHHHDIKSCGSMYCACEITGDCVNVVKSGGKHTDLIEVHEKNTTITVEGTLTQRETYNAIDHTVVVGSATYQRMAVNLGGYIMYVFVDVASPAITGAGGD
jgi:hypothetical protein